MGLIQDLFGQYAAPLAARLGVERLQRLQCKEPLVVRKGLEKVYFGKEYMSNKVKVSELRLLERNKSCFFL